MSQILIDKKELTVLLSQFDEIEQRQEFGRDQLNRSFKLYNLFFEIISQNDPVQFTTLFSRIAFISTKFQWSGDLISQNHYYRRRLENRIYKEEQFKELILLAPKLVKININHIADLDLHFDVEPFFQKLSRGKSTLKKKRFERILRGMAFSVNEQLEFLVVLENDPEQHSKVTLKSEQAKRHLKGILKFIEFPVVVSFVDNSISDEGFIQANMFVIQPDFLFGVTSVSECFQSGASNALKYLSSKLIPQDYSVHLLLGNIVNFFLDELISNPEVSFKRILPSIFKLAPTQFALLSDIQLADLLGKLKTHFLNLQDSVKNGLINLKIHNSNSYLEPSFYSNEFGLQGRLDLLHDSSSDENLDIVELKSGRLFRANAYGLNANHYTQTLLYDLLAESVYRGKRKANSYILYSALTSDQLKYAPKVRKKQYEALKVRNELYILESVLAKSEEGNFQSLTSFLDPSKVSTDFRFLKKGAEQFSNTIQKLDALEIAYYSNFLGFVSREFQLSKTGEHGIFKSNGLASIWLDSTEEKMEAFRMLSYLNIKEHITEDQDSLIVLTYSDRSNILSRFRNGDIAVFYPDKSDVHSALLSQVFKCTIISINSEEITIRLRAKQGNFQIFDENRFWHLEPDMLESGFTKQLHGLYEFINASKRFRDLILTRIKPDKPNTKGQFFNNPHLTQQQKEILNEAIVSPDYYLLWGPPGTGKTSVMIKNLADFYMNKTKLNVLFLAYTNKAVDEISDAVSSIQNAKFIRIGSRFSTKEKFKSRLLSTIMEKVKSRKTLLNMINETRFFVSTVSSFQSNLPLLKIKKFDIVIIDEASQLLEPMIVGLLTKFKKFILIGDHKQLPAVVTQKPDQSFCKSHELDAIGLVDMRISLFERMYKCCERNEWNWVIGALRKQGRMHQTIQQFVSPVFYENNLGLLDIERLTQKPALKDFNTQSAFLIQNRMIFIDVPIDHLLTNKTNQREAKLAVEIIDLWGNIYMQNNLQIEEDSIGVITPFRSQIALIKEGLDNLPSRHIITVDTIERYQGGSRNQIVISLSVNQNYALRQISSLTDEGIDRKLNVALTRAKEHVIILGNKKVLETNPLYAQLIDYCRCINLADFEQL